MLGLVELHEVCLRGESISPLRRELGFKSYIFLVLFLLGVSKDTSTGDAR